MVDSPGVVVGGTDDRDNLELRSRKGIRTPLVVAFLIHKVASFLPQHGPHFLKLICRRLPGNRDAGHLLVAGRYLGRTAVLDHARATPERMTASKRRLRFGLAEGGRSAGRSQIVIQRLAHTRAVAVRDLRLLLDRRRAEVGRLPLLVLGQA